MRSNLLDVAQHNDSDKAERWKILSHTGDVDDDDYVKFKSINWFHNN